MERISPRLAIFDIDGTLLQTDRFWLEIGRRAVAELYERHAVRAEIPEPERMLQAIGLPAPDFWHAILPPKLHSLAEEVESHAQDLEEIAFSEGNPLLYPGARELLEELRERGCRLALASNCGERYLRGFVSAFDLGHVLDAKRCLESPGIVSKTQMVTEILEETNTVARSAVMIGDRESDRRAARENGIAFVRFTGGFGTVAEEPGEITATSYAEIRTLL